MALTEAPGGPTGPGDPKGPGLDHGEGDESTDASEVPYLPRRPDRPRALLGSRRRQVVAFGIIAVALGVLLWKGLGNATVYFKTADEAVAQRAKLGSRTFRIEGTVQPDVRRVGQDVSFVIANNGVTVNVLDHSDPPQLFKPGIPVVLQGHFALAGYFACDQIMVKHTASYSAAHPGRVKTAETTIPQLAPTAP